MNLKDFAREMVKESGLGATALRTGKRLVGGLTGSTVKGLETDIAAHAGDLTDKSQRRLGRLSQMLPKAKAYQRNVRIGAGAAGAGLIAGHMLTKKDNE